MQKGAAKISPQSAAMGARLVEVDLFVLAAHPLVFFRIDLAADDHARSSAYLPWTLGVESWALGVFSSVHGHRDARLHGVHAGLRPDAGHSALSAPVHSPTPAAFSGRPIRRVQEACQPRVSSSLSALDCHARAKPAAWSF